MSKEKVFKIDVFKYPSSDKIKGRISTIRRSMACTMLKREGCSREEEKRWKEFFPKRVCAYCGEPTQYLDHLHPLIDDKGPTGYGTEPGNLVPCCRSCNQAKGNKDWRVYIESICDNNNEDAKKEKERRIDIIEQFQKEMKPQKVDISRPIKEEWLEQVKRFNDLLDEINNKIIEMSKRIYEQE